MENNICKSCGMVMAANDQLKFRLCEGRNKVIITIRLP